MYYRYKPRKRERRVLKRFLFFLVMAAFLSAAYYFRSYLMFWKYTDNRVLSEISAAASVVDSTKRVAGLNDLDGVMRKYRDDNPLKSEPFLMSGKVSYMLGASLLGEDFSWYFIEDRPVPVPDPSSRHFIAAVKHIKKGIALNGSSDIPSQYRVILARAMYYTSFKSTAEIASVVENVDVDTIDDKEELRFLSYILASGKSPEKGFRILAERCVESGNEKARLFEAAVKKKTGKYTDAIMVYRDIIASSKDERVLKIARLSLGKVYYGQLLYREAVARFEEALRFDPENTEIKGWMDRALAASGDRQAAARILKNVGTQLE